MLYVFTDASYALDADRFGIGASVRSEAGEEIAVCAAAIGCPSWCTSSLAERHAALEALRFARAIGEPVELRTDDQALALVLRGEATHSRESVAADALRQYVALLREEVARGVVVRWIPRGENGRANALARWALRSAGPLPAGPGELVPVRGQWRRRWPAARTASAA